MHKEEEIALIRRLRRTLRAKATRSGMILLTLKYKIILKVKMHGID